MRFNSITILPTTTFELYHNTREEKPSSSIFSTEKNEVSPAKAKEAEDLYKDLIIKRSVLHKEVTGKKLPVSTATLLSAVVVLDEKHTFKDLKKVADYLAGKFNTDILQIALHRDEGYIDADGNKYINHHGHIVFLGVDKNGMAIKNRIKKKVLYEVQNDVSKMLAMPKLRFTDKVKIPHLDLKPLIRYGKVDKRIVLQNNALKEKVYNLEKKNASLEAENELLRAKRKKTALLLLEMRKKLYELKNENLELKRKIEKYLEMEKEKEAVKAAKMEVVE